MRDVKELLRFRAQKELARREFWEYCKFTSPDFYKEDRAFLKDLAIKLQWFIEEADQQIMYRHLDLRI